MDVTGKSLVVGMLLERVGSAALLYMLVASTPYMGGLLCAPSGEVGRRGNFCMLCILCFSSSSSSLQSAPQTCCPHQRSNVRLAPASLTSTPPGTGAGMETEEVHCSCKDLEISRTYGSTQTSTSWLLRERLVCGTPWCARNRTYFDKYSNLLTRGGKGVFHGFPC